MRGGADACINERFVGSREGARDPGQGNRPAPAPSGLDGPLRASKWIAEAETTATVRVDSRNLRKLVCFPMIYDLHPARSLIMVAKIRAEYGDFLLMRRSRKG
jgi:hypothetical protein